MDKEIVPKEKHFCLLYLIISQRKKKYGYISHKIYVALIFFFC